MAPASIDDVLAFETKFNVRCPDDFAGFLTKVGGMSDGSWDKSLIRFWPLPEILPATGVPGVAGSFVCADYSISAAEYAIRLADPSRGQVILLSGAKPRIVAETFTQFLRLYVADSPALF